MVGHNLYFYGKILSPYYSCYPFLSGALRNINTINILSGTSTLLFSFLPPFSTQSAPKKKEFAPLKSEFHPLTLLHSERPKLYTILAFLSAIGLREDPFWKGKAIQRNKQEVMKVVPPFRALNKRGWGIEDNSKVVFLISE